MRFKGAGRGRVDVTLGELELDLLRQLVGELLALLDEGDAPLAEAEDDPLAAVVGIGTATAVPDDPALARLLPDAYRDDPEAAAEFRRYTESDLRERKRASARTVLDTLGAPRQKVRLSAEAAQAWLLTFNDLRLALGARLRITEDWDRELAELAEDDPRGYALAVYDHLTHMQELLVQALS